MFYGVTNCKSCVYEPCTSSKAVCFDDLKRNGSHNYGEAFEREEEEESLKFHVFSFLGQISQAPNQSSSLRTESPLSVPLSQHAKPCLILSLHTRTLQLLQPFPPYFLVVVLDLDISVVRKKESTEEEKAIKATSLQKGGVPITMMQPARQKRDEYVIFTEKLYSVDSGFNCSNR